MSVEDQVSEPKWYVMRDLKRRNALRPAYIELEEKGYTVFTPKEWVIVKKNGRPERRQQPVIAGLLFVNSVKADLDPAVSSTPTLQYLYQKGHSADDPAVVRPDDMERFIRAVSATDDPRYYMPSEVTPSMIGRRVTIIDGPLAGMSGNLLAIRGTRKRRFLVNLPGLLVAAVEVEPAYLRFD